MVNQGSVPTGERIPMRFELTIDGKRYQVQIVRPGMIAVDGNVFNVEMTSDGVKVDNELFVASVGTDLSTVGGRLYKTEWKVQ